MTKLIYPTLDIFLYDLREGLGQTEAEVEQNRNNFKQKLPQTIDENRFIQLDEQSFEPEYVELLDKRIEPLHLPDNWQGDGYYYPVRLSDSYGLLLDGLLKEAQHLADLTWLHDMQTYLNGKLNGQTGTLGQTWMFSAQLPNVPAKEYEAIAKRCYEALIPGADYTKNQMGHSAFLGGRLFELWRYTSPEQKPINQNHPLLSPSIPMRTRPKKRPRFTPTGCDY
jgi:hypothetical protein